MRTGSTLVILVTLTLFLPGCDQGTPSPAATASAEASGPMTLERRRAWAAKLRADGFDDQALAVYERMLEDGRGLSDKAMVGTSVIVADIHIQKRRYEEALASLYRASLFEPSGDLARKIDEKKILCLERLGLSTAADRVLDQAARLGKEKGTADAGGAVVLALIGEREVTQADLDVLIAAMSPEMREAVASDPAKQIEVLRSYVASQVLHRKADKLELEKNPKVRLAMEAASREILVRALVADEIKDKVAVTPEDAKLYYEAHRDRFREPLELSLAHILVPDAEAEATVRERLDAETFEALASTLSRDVETASRGGVLESPVKEGAYHATFVNVGDVVSAVGETPGGGVAPDAVVTTAGRHVLKVIERKGGRKFSFEEVAEQAMRMLRAERERAAVEAMMKQALDSSDVTIFADRLRKP